ncbi:hypothetical protein [Streptomyces tateyamensis]|nr:hypothetical protein [Streptomyces tateyamensis]
MPDVAEGFPRSGVHQGLDRIVGDFFPFRADFAECATFREFS